MTTAAIPKAGATGLASGGSPVLRSGVVTSGASRAVSDLSAYVANDGTWEALLLGPGASTTYRDRRGIWVSPAPPIAAGELFSRFTCLDPTSADRLNWEAVHALAGPELQEPRPTPAQLVNAARDYRRRCIEASALRQTEILLRQFTLRTHPREARPSPGLDQEENPDTNAR